ncbi:MAG: nitrogen regulation protein NR(II) [Nitrospiraceae bacterium]
MTSSPAGADPTNGALLARAFQDFDQAACVLQQSYAALTTRLRELDLELAQSNATLRKHLKETEEMRAHLTAILESVDTGILVTDRDGTVTRCNAAVEQMLGMPRASLEGRAAHDILRDANMDRREYPLVVHGGIAVSMAQTQLSDPAGHAIGSLHLFHDVTKVRHLEERLQRRNRLAAMGEMVGCIAHEIRNPLGSVELFASMLRKDLHDQPRLRSYAEHISVAVQAMDRLLSNLLLYMKPDRSQAARLEVEPLVQEALALAAHALSSASIEVRFDSDRLVSGLWCDAAQIKQVLLNLILNAAQAMPQGGLLTITARADGGRRQADAQTIRLTVRDTGPGIPPEHQSRIFDPFFTTKEEGTGLGLAIVHALVEAHHGRIDVESVLGQGTAFIVTLPGQPGASCEHARDEMEQALPVGEEQRS